jgi:hypothetical protein
MEDELVQGVWLDEAQPDCSLHQRCAEQREQNVSDNYDTGYYRRWNTCAASYSWQRFQLKITQRYMHDTVVCDESIVTVQ